jgi:hypothetical protein
MCCFKSAIVTRDGRIMHHDATDSHTDLISHFKLREGKAGENFVRVEFTPDGNAFADVDKYTLRIDETRVPAWFDEETTEKTVKALKRVIRSMIICDERDMVLGGTWIVGDGAKVATFRNTRIIAITSGAYLKSAYLKSANLESANLYGANLKSAYLKSANLESANLYGANLKSANLESANLESANLESANLYGAYLKSANLYGANLYGANLYGANLYGANLYGANLESAYRPADPPAGWRVSEGGILVKA